MVFFFLIFRSTNGRERSIAGVSTIQRESTTGERAVKSSRDEREGAYRGGEGGEEPT